MDSLLYGELVPFYHLLDPVEDHEDEGATFGRLLEGAAPGARSLLELGAGAAHGAHYVKRFSAHPQGPTSIGNTTARVHANAMALAMAPTAVCPVAP